MSKKEIVVTAIPTGKGHTLAFDEELPYNFLSRDGLMSKLLG